jgi:Spy/CpxP family protein refolding chaperone
VGKFFATRNPQLVTRKGSRLNKSIKGGTIMNTKTKRTVTIALAFALVVASALAVEARHLGQRPRHHSIGLGLKGLKTFLELKLSDAQQTEILRIIEKRQDNKKNILREIRKARKALQTLMQNAEFNEVAVRKAIQDVHAMREDLIVLKGKIMAELKEVLTPEQNTLLEQRRAQKNERMKDRCFFPGFPVP